MEDVSILVVLPILSAYRQRIIASTRRTNALGAGVELEPSNSDGYEVCTRFSAARTRWTWRGWPGFRLIRAQAAHFQEVATAPGVHPRRRLSIPHVTALLLILRGSTCPRFGRVHTHNAGVADSNRPLPSRAPERGWS